MKTYVVAVSGGVDSVVLLDMMARALPSNLVVAHFDHGIRPDSKEDADFVASLAARYNLVLETRREELRKGASEELARDRRYAFLREVARKHDGVVVTAHHANDLTETIAINLTRGTGWRGLAVLDSDIQRPLLHLTKAQLIDHALKRRLSWRDDPTNESDEYLRNRLRKKASALTANDTTALRELRHAQVALRRQIDEEVAALVGPGPQYSRYFMTHIPHEVALECLRFISEGRLTRPQQARALHAVKTLAPGRKYEAGSGVVLSFTTRNFSRQLLK